MDTRTIRTLHRNFSQAIEQSHDEGAMNDALVAMAQLDDATIARVMRRVLASRRDQLTYDRVAADRPTTVSAEQAWRNYM